MKTVNIYSRQFTATCCANNQRIIYDLEIESATMIRVEEINEVLDRITEGFHEDIADRLFERFGGRQTIKAHHHGVDIESVRE